MSNYAGSRSSMDGSTEFTLDLEGHAGLQRSAEVGAPNYVNIITAVAYHFCPSLPAAFTQPCALTLADLLS